MTVERDPTPGVISGIFGVGWFAFGWFVWRLDWFWSESLRCGFWNGQEEYCGGSEWLSLLALLLTGIAAAPLAFSAIYLIWAGNPPIPHGIRPEGASMGITEARRNEMFAGLGVLWGGSFWSLIWLYCLPHTWGMMPFEHGWGWIFLWALLLLPFGASPLIWGFNLLLVGDPGKKIVETVAEFGERALQRGMSGDDVRTLQELLNKNGASIIVDGSFGNQTHGAVVKFQTDNGLAFDGIVRPQTVSALTHTPNKHHDEHIEKGMSGDEVRKLQELLNKHGASISVDGRFGSQTYGAVVKFQNDNDLTVDGVVGPQTWGALTESEEADFEPDGGPSVTLDKESFGSHELIAVTFQNGFGNPTDWIGIYRADAPVDEHNHHGNWLFVGGGKEPGEGRTDGELLIVHELPEGDYKVAFCANNGYQVLASATFGISDESDEEDEPEPEPEPSTSDEVKGVIEQVEGALDSEDLAASDIEALATAVEELAEDPDFDADITELRGLAETQLEEQIARLPSPMRDSARAKLTAKLDAVEAKMRGRLPDVNKAAVGVAAAAGVAGAAAAWAATHRVEERVEAVMEDGEVDFEEVSGLVREAIDESRDEDPEKLSEPEVEPLSEAEVSEPEDSVQPPPTSVGSASEFARFAGDVKSALTSSQRSKIIKEKLSGEWPLRVVVESVHRTMGIGLDDDHRDGRTIEGVIEGTDISVSILASAVNNANLDELEPGMTFVTNCVVKEYRPVLRAFELLA